MNQEQVKYFEEIILKAVQSGKQETSGLVELVIHKMEGHIEKSVTLAIEKNVNGKIRALDTKIDDYISLDLQWKKEDEQWKEDIKPQIQLVKDTQGFGRITLGFLAFVTAIGGCIILIYNLLKLK